MNVEQKVARLWDSVKVAFDEFTLVMRLYETWRPAAFDEDLFERMGPSYPSHAFLLIREVLAREVVLCLTKLWDTTDRAIRMDRLTAETRVREGITIGFELGHASSPVRMGLADPLVVAPRGTYQLLRSAAFAGAVTEGGRSHMIVRS